MIFIFALKNRSKWVQTEIKNKDQTKDFVLHVSLPKKLKMDPSQSGEKSSKLIVENDQNGF